MTNSKFAKYVELFLQYYNDRKIDVKWERESLKLRPLIDLKEELQKKDSNYSEDEFIEVVFSVLKIVRDLSSGLSPKMIDEDKLKIIKEIFTSDPDILEHVRVHSASVVNTFEGLDYEILTKRSKINPNEIIGKSILLSFIYNDASGSDSNRRLTLELTTKELTKIMKNLGDILGKIKKVDN